MSKLKLIIKREFLAKVKNKSFIIMTILSPLLMVGLFSLIVFLNQKNSEEVRTVAFVDDSHMLSTAFTDTPSTKYIEMTVAFISPRCKEMLTWWASDVTTEQRKGRFNFGIHHQNPMFLGPATTKSTIFSF